MHCKRTITPIYILCITIVVPSRLHDTEVVDVGEAIPCSINMWAEVEECHRAPLLLQSSTVLSIAITNDIHKPAIRG